MYILPKSDIESLWPESERPLRPDTSTTGLDLWTWRIFSVELLCVVLFRHWFVSGWGAFLPYIFLNVEETHCNVSQETLKGLWCTQGSKFKPGFAGFNQASQRPPAFVLQSICVCVWPSAWTSRDAMKPQAAEHFAHVRIIVMNTITHVVKNDVTWHKWKLSYILTKFT